MSKIAFCFIVKDGGTYLEKNLDRLIELGNLYFDEYKIFYAENDSKDNTINILNKYKNKYKNIYGEHLLLDGKHSTELCEGYEINCKKRTRRLAYLRNIVLNKAKKWKECDYMIMLDLDFIDFDKNEFYNMFNIINNNKNINGIFGMSVTKDNTNCLYDIGAVKPIINILIIRNDEDKLIKVTSAFSGFGIYRMQPLINNNIEYNTKTNEIEHIDFNRNINNLYVYTLYRPVYEGNCSSPFFHFHKGIINYYISIFIIFIISIVSIVYYINKSKR
jgi:hypothetical protein